MSVTGLDYETFLRITPEQCIIVLLLLIDNALVRGQEMELMQTNIPFTDATFASLLATGSVLTSKLVEYFVETQSFDDRAMKSLTLISSGIPEGTADQLSTNTLELYFLEGELEVSPENYRALRNQVDVCTLTFDSDPTNDTELALVLWRTVNAECVDIVACRQIDCRYDEDEFAYYASYCDIVIDTDEDGHVFLSTVAYSDLFREMKKDAQLLGLHVPRG